MMCDNCGEEIVSDRHHHPDAYEKGVCLTYIQVNGQNVFMGWVRNRKTVDFNQANIEGRKKLAQ